LARFWEADFKIDLSGGKGKINYMRGKWLYFLLLIPLAQVWAGSLYYYVDENGVWHFSDTRRDERFNKMIIWPEQSNSSIKLNLDINFDYYIKDACRLYGVEENLVRAMIKVESNFDPNAVSKKGAQGLMQLMPKTAEMFRLIDPFHPRENIYAGVAYFKSLLVKYQWNERLALAGYNAGPGAVDKYNGIPPYPETQNYVKKVLEYRDQYQGKYVPKSKVIILSERTAPKQ